MDDGRVLFLAGEGATRLGAVRGAPLFGRVARGFTVSAARPLVVTCARRPGLDPLVLDPAAGFFADAGRPTGSVNARVPKTAKTALLPLSWHTPVCRVSPYGNVVFVGPMQAVFHSGCVHSRLPDATQASSACTSLMNA